MKYKPVQIFTEMVAIWALLITAWIFKGSFENIIYLIVFLSLNVSYYLFRSLNPKSLVRGVVGYIQDFTLTAIFVLLAAVMQTLLQANISGWLVSWALFLHISTLMLIIIPTLFLILEIKSGNLILQKPKER